MFEKAIWITADKEKKEAADTGSSKQLPTGEVVASVINPEGRLDPAPLFRKTFRIEKEVESAEIRTTAAGLYRLTVNGETINSGLYDPGWTDYETRIQVQSQDVTGLIRAENTLEILAGCGWAGAGLLGAGEHFFSDRVCVISELKICYRDGTEETVATDDTWEVWHSFLRFTHPYQGEVIDFNKEPEYIGKAVPAEVNTTPVPQEKEYVTAHERLGAKRMSVTPEGETVIDFG